jgi:hypothetical protein
MKIETELKRVKEELASCRRLNENLEGQVRILTAQNESFKKEFGAQHEAIQSYRKLVERLKLDLILRTRAIRVVKAALNGIRIPGADDYNTNEHVVVSPSSTSNELGG